MESDNIIPNSSLILEPIFKEEEVFYKWWTQHVRFVICSHVSRSLNLIYQNTGQHSKICILHQLCISCSIPGDFQYLYLKTSDGAPPDAN